MTTNLLRVTATGLLILIVAACGGGNTAAGDDAPVTQASTALSEEVAANEPEDAGAVIYE
jgi:hypothetical protein